MGNTQQEQAVDSKKIMVMSLDELDNQIASVEVEQQEAVNVQIRCQGALNVLRFWREKAVAKKLEQASEQAATENQQKLAEAKKAAESEAPGG